VTGKSECEREVVVGLLLPAAAPCELELLREPAQVFSGRGRNEVEDALHGDELARGWAHRIEPEERDHAIDVNEQEGLVHERLTPSIHVLNPGRGDSHKQLSQGSATVRIDI
jgi:hypothetical protein